MLFSCDSDEDWKKHWSGCVGSFMVDIGIVKNIYQE